MLYSWRCINNVCYFIFSRLSKIDWPRPEKHRCVLNYSKISHSKYYFIRLHSQSVLLIMHKKKVFVTLKILRLYNNLSSSSNDSLLKIKSYSCIYWFTKLPNGISKKFDTKLFVFYLATSVIVVRQYSSIIVNFWTLKTNSRS